MGEIRGDNYNEPPMDGPLKDFVKETTIHGIRNATSANSGLLRRLLWFVAFTAACSYLTFQLVTLALEFYSYPFKTVSRIVPRTSSVFPSVTICDLNKFDSKLVNFSTELRTIYRVKNAHFWSEFSNLTMESLRQTEPYRSILRRTHAELTEMAAPTVNKTFIWCVFDDVGGPCNEYIKYINTPGGRCFIFNNDMFNPRISSRPGDKGGFFALMKVDLSEYTYSYLQSVGFKVVIHCRFDAPDVNANGPYISPGFTNEIRFNEHQLEFLPEPYNSYGGKTCLRHTQTEGIQAPGAFSFSRCLKAKADRAARDKCNCDWDDCTLDSFLTCFQPTFNEFYNNAMKTDRAGCDVPCEMVTYTQTTSSTTFPVPDAMGDLARLAQVQNSSQVKYLILNVFFDDFMVREDRHVPEYDHLSLLGTLGGHVGLFLGASLLTFGEFTELIVLTLMGAVKRFYRLVKSREPRKVNADREVKDKNNYKNNADREGQGKN